MICLSFFKASEGQIRVHDVLKRVLISIILLFSFREIISLIDLIGESIVAKIDGLAKLIDVLGQAKEVYFNFAGSWFKAREAIIYTLNLLAYMVAYVGVFTAQVLTKFVWSILFICSPLMILAYINEKTAYITSNLFKGLIHVVIWKVLWSILGVILLKFATAPQSGSWDNFLSSAMINLCIGFSMLFIPFATKSLLGDGMTGAASALAAVPAGATFKTLQGIATKYSKKSMGQVGRSFSRGGRTLLSVFSGENKKEEKSPTKSKRRKRSRK